MSEPAMTTEAAQATVGTEPAEKPIDARPKPRTISQPREVAALVLAHINRVNAKKDDLTIAIKGLTDITQQLATSYARQMQVIGELSNRIKALEGKTDSDGAVASPVVKKTAGRAKQAALSEYKP